MMIRGGAPRMGEPLNKSFHDRSILDGNPCRFGVFTLNSYQIKNGGTQWER
jgi:hypothetical protein